MKKTIKEVQSLVGLSRSQIQRFENAGLCTKPTEKNKYGHLLYDDAATQRLMLLRYYHDLGYSRRESNTICPDLLKFRLYGLSARAGRQPGPSLSHRISEIFPWRRGSLKFWG